MFLKPKWYKRLPTYMKPSKNDKIEHIEKIRKKDGLPHELIFQLVASSPWAIKKTQEYILKQNRRRMPNASEKELWKSVISSRFEVKLVYHHNKFGNLSPDVNPLPEKEILSRIEKIDNIVAEFKTWDNVVEYIVCMDKEEGAFFDPLGIQAQFNNLLEMGESGYKFQYKFKLSELVKRQRRRR